MAFRISSAIVRGELTNEVPGIITGRLWLLGRDKPLVLQLQGDARSDLAGCSLTFTNPEPAGDPLDGLATYQIGSVGTITASHKARIPTVSEDELVRLIQKNEPIPYRYANCLYIEWFSDANGRVVIETEAFELDISEPRWVLPAEPTTPPGEQEPLWSPDDDAPEFSFDHAAPGEDEDAAEFDDEPLDEFEWELELRDAEACADEYQQALENFGEHIDQREFLDRFIEGDSKDAPTGTPSPGQQISEKSAGGDGSHQNHELTARALDLAFEFRRRATTFGLLRPLGSTPETPDAITMTVAAVIQLGGKLAAALDGLANGADPERGFIIAMLKRSLPPLNDAHSGITGAMENHAATPAVTAWLAEARVALHDLRTDILDLMDTLRAADDGSAS